MDNVYAVAARNKKAAALVAVLRRIGISRSLAETADDSEWAVVAREAGVNPPSRETIEVVLQIMRDAETPAPECNCRQIDVDQVDARDCPQHSQKPDYPQGETSDEPCPF